ncbi:unnamed protein product [Parascedosporium putredinis]|uniref:DUF7029 domain-containing protein n=1 Tax=Parascedosporium putredinis TaxID=1442378 RepID=A0A9P1H8B0_9PEZI|nr:unnamed protein product [Parascedosporium putredinis]CAI8000622.1 unnamed protein product [Parascedosporium putredinis]
MKFLSCVSLLAALLASVEGRGRAGGDTTHEFRPATHKFKPCSRPKKLPGSRKPLIPKKEVHLAYDPVEEGGEGSIDMTLLMKEPAVVLEDVEDIIGTICGKGFIDVSFLSKDAFDEALADWIDNEALIFITNHLGNCDTELERGFFLASGLEPNAETLSIRANAAKKTLETIAADLEINFTSIPGATVDKRAVIDPSLSITISEGLDPNTVLYTDGTYFTLTANEAQFTATATFSGYLHYNFLLWRLEALYFDIDASFDASSPSRPTLSYDFVSVPGIVKLGPGLDFGIGCDLDVSAAVGVTTSAGTGTSGWEPQYRASANITERAEVGVDVYVDLTVELAFELLGGLVDLSAGITATPGFDNKFTVAASQGAGVESREAGEAVTKRDVAVVGLETRQEVACAETNAVHLVTDFTSR